VKGGLLVITAHPDDETLIAGGTLAACAARGVRSGVVCLTRGEHGPIAERALASRRTLGEVRARELAAACELLGVSFVRCYRREDGNVSASAGGPMIRQLQRVIEEFAPDAVITFGEDGLYWHPDHIATYAFVRRAVRRIATPPTLYRAIWPEELMLEMSAALRDRGLPHDIWSVPPEDFGTDELDGCFELDVKRFVAGKLAALRCHRTQIGDTHAFAVIEGELAEQFMGVERFAVVSDEPAGPPRERELWLREAVGNG
jgi:LmbE family N-acetylglucosaminyl deacetylase